MRNKVILITGGAGFIGYNLYTKLKKNNEIYILDLPKKIKLKQFDKNCKIVLGDISSKKIFKDLEKKKIKFDYIFHLAAETSTYLAEQNPRKCYKTNLYGTLNLFNFCKQNKPQNLIFSSSMAVYGKNSIKPKEQKKCLPISHYGFSKLIGEKILLNLKKYNINVKIFRIFNAYGVYQDYNNPYQGMLSIYLSQILRQSLVHVTGSLNRSRDFIYISDIIDVFINKKIISNPKNHIFNLGSGKETRVRSILEKIFKILNKEKKILVKKKHSGDTLRSCANIDKLKKNNFYPKISLEVGIKKVIKDLKYFDENNCNFNWQR